MCGISGILAFTEKGRDSLSSLRASVQCLDKRGPDAQGFFIHENVGLGHARLSIIDTSELSSQPFTDSSGRFTIVYNGEFFNYMEHRQKLISEGIEFRSNGDTEVLLNLYIREKEKCLEKINGFFAFAIYDKLDGSLFIARDRYGIKPLYYYQDTERIIFGSEIKSLEAFGFHKTLDLTSLQTYLQLNFIPSPHSIFKGVKKLLPGHYLRIAAKKSSLFRYYEIPKQINPKSEGFYNLLEDAVKSRLIADVPLGCFLSGGLDSSVITALASKHKKGLKTFSIGYRDEPFFDETRYANLVAGKCKTDHTVFSLTNDDLFDSVFKVLDYLDEPFGDSSALPFYILSSKTSMQVKVALSGDGADELLAGYNRHRAEYNIRKGGLKNMLVAAGSPLWSLLPKSRNHKLTNLFRQLHRFSEGMSLSHDNRYWRWSSYMTSKEAENLLIQNCTPDIFNERKRELLSELNATDFNSVLRTDMRFILENDMLVKADRMSMANSLEVRTPFLDYRVVNYLFSQSAEQKIDHQTQKILLKKTFGHLLPPELLTRKKKGFEVPLLKWLRKDLSFLSDTYLSKEHLESQGLFEYGQIKRIRLQLNSSDPGESASIIWGLLCFQHWYKKHMN